MAGRPAAGGTSGVLVGMIVSVVVAVVLLVLLVILWTHQERLRAEADKSNDQLNRVLRSNEMQGPLKQWYDQADQRNSVARLMNQEMLTLGELISSDVEAATPDLADQIRETQLMPFWRGIEQDAEEGLLEDPGSLVERPLFDALTSLYRMYETERTAHAEAQSTIDDLNAQLADLNRLNSELQTSFTAKAAELEAALAAMQDEWSQFRTEKEDEFSSIEASNQIRADERLREKQKLNDQLQQLGGLLDKQETRNRELQEKIKEFQILPQPRMALRQADGMVLKAEAGEDTVFIDLGIDDHLTLGLRFAVYPPDPGIPSSGVAKAAVEVVKIGEAVSECRVKGMDPMFPILGGDLVANPVYDRNRQLSFFVVGEYDLDHDGLDDPNGKGTIEAVILDFGGRLSDNLTTRTDFLIVGARPAVSATRDDASPEQLAVRENEIRRARAYDAVIDEALSLTIPMLTQETFLNFLGRISG